MTTTPRLLAARRTAATSLLPSGPMTTPTRATVSDARSPRRSAHAAIRAAAETTRAFGCGNTEGPYAASRRAVNEGPVAPFSLDRDPMYRQDGAVPGRG